MATSSRLINLSYDAQEALVAGSRDSEPVRGLTHGYYKYPARFSPVFVRAAIEAFTRPGDLILDNHVGGGTTLVEALALGRHALGVDVSTLAEFVATVKTTVLNDRELERMETWANELASVVDIRKSSKSLTDYANLGYYKHLDHPKRWRLRKAIEQALGSAVRLGPTKLEAFARCLVLRTAQRALDGRKEPPSLAGFRNMLSENAVEMIEGARQLQAAVKRHKRSPTIAVINRSAAGLETDPRVLRLAAPKLVLTSPPYPGVHVLYHRWQVDGGKEAPLPFMIANKLDGSGESYYTMGSRKSFRLKNYFENILATMSSVSALADEDTIVVQMVAFSKQRWQLTRYLKTMERAGLSEVFLPTLQNKGDGRLWRSVPGRRWYSDQRGETPGSKEVVLIHIKARETIRRTASVSFQRPSVL